MNKTATSATLILQTIMVLMKKPNTTDVPSYPSSFSEDAELERCYQNYGCFSRAYPWTDHRPDNYFPATPESMGIKYAAFTRRNRKIPVLLQATDPIEKIQNANLDARGPFYIISHGFLDGGNKIWIQNMADALLNLSGNEAATVLVVDWRGGSQPPYGQAVANIRLVGVMTAHLVNNIYVGLGLSNLDNFHFIGHSLGAHLGGYCGHALQKKFNLKLGRITGLDPAAPYFSKTVTIVRLDRSDAKYVDIIHSNAMPLYYSGFGISEPIGHVDFYPNGGSTQPGCKTATSQPSSRDDMYKLAVTYVGCNHERSFIYFTESIAPTCPFLSIQCNSYESFVAGNCSACDKHHLCIPMGYHSYNFYKRLQSSGLVDTNSNIALFAKTGSTKPFCRVHYLVTMKVSNSSESITHGPDVGKVSLTLIDKHNNKSDHKLLNEEQKYYKPGDIEMNMVAFKDTGHPPLSVIVEWKYETHLFNPITWRLLKSPSIYIEYIKFSSMEYNTDITVCPKLHKPVVANLPTVMKTKYCKLGK